MCVIRGYSEKYIKMCFLSPHKYAIFKSFSHLPNSASGWYVLPKYTIASAQKKENNRFLERPQFLYTQLTLSTFDLFAFKHLR